MTKKLFFYFFTLFFAFTKCKMLTDNQNKHVHFFFSEHFEGPTTIFLTQNCGRISDSIYINDSILAISSEIPTVLQLGEITYWHFWKFDGLSYFEVPVYPKSSKKFTISTTVSGSVNDFDLIKLRLSHIERDSIYLKDGYDEFKYKSNYENQLFDFVDSLIENKCYPATQ